MTSFFKVPSEEQKQAFLGGLSEKPAYDLKLPALFFGVRFKSHEFPRSNITNVSLKLRHTVDRTKLGDVSCPGDPRFSVPDHDNKSVPKRQQRRELTL